MPVIVNALIGLLFGLGLVVSGMSDTAKVKNFLDLFGTLDPSLAFVLGGAVIVAFIGYRLVGRPETQMTECATDTPPRTGIDRKLLGGAAVFGIGWGLSGYCPGPALTSLALSAAGTLVFVVAMFAGLWAARRVSSEPG